MPRSKYTHPTTGSKTLRIAAAAAAASKPKLVMEPRPASGSKHKAAAAAAVAAVVAGKKKQTIRAPLAASDSESGSDSGEEEEEEEESSASEDEEKGEESSASEEEEEEEPIAQMLGTAEDKPRRLPFRRPAAGSPEEKQAARRRAAAEKQRQKRVKEAKRHADRVVARLTSDQPQPHVEAPKAASKTLLTRIFFALNDGKHEPIRMCEAFVERAPQFATSVLEHHVLPDALKRRTVSIPLKRLEEDALLALVHAREIDDANRLCIRYMMTQPRFRGLDILAVYERELAVLVGEYEKKATLVRAAAKETAKFDLLDKKVKELRKEDAEGTLGHSGRRLLVEYERDLSEYRLTKYRPALARAKKAHKNAIAEKALLVDTVIPAIEDELKVDATEEKRAVYKAAKKKAAAARAKYDEASGRVASASKEAAEYEGWVQERDAAKAEKREAKAALEVAERAYRAVPRERLALTKRLTQKKVALLQVQKRLEALAENVKVLTKSIAKNEQIHARALAALGPSSPAAAASSSDESDDGMEVDDE